MVDEISQRQIQEALERLDRLCKDEYGDDHDLLTLLQTPDTDMSARRLRRLTGVLVKEPFAEWHPIGTDFTATGSTRAWDWCQPKLDGADQESPEFKLLNDLAKAMPKLVEYTAYPGGTVDDLIQEAKHESGLYKVLALYVRDKISKSETKSFREYYGEKTGKTFNALTSVASELAGMGLTAAAGLAIGPAAIAVPFALIALNFGLESAFAPDNEKDNDN